MYQERIPHIKTYGVDDFVVRSAAFESGPRPRGIIVFEDRQKPRNRIQAESRVDNRHENNTAVIDKREEKSERESRRKESSTS